MNGEIVAVLDLGSTKAVCLAATADGAGGVKALGLGVVESRGVRRGVVTDLDEASRTVDAVVRRAQQESGGEITRLVVGVSGMHVEGQNAQGFVPIYPRSRHVTREDVLQVINHSRQIMIPPDREQIQAIPREFRVDGQRNIHKPVGMSGARLEVVTYLVTGQTSQISNLEKAITMAGRKIEQLVLQPLASGLGVLTEEELDLGTAVVDMGAGKTDLAIFTGGSIAYSATLPVGSSLVTSDLSKLLRATPEEAERLKLAYGSAIANYVPDDDDVDVHQIGQTQPRPMQRRVLCEIIESRMRELATMLRQHIERSGTAPLLAGGVVLTGGGSLLPDTDRLMEDVLRHTRVRVTEPVIPGAPARPGLAAVLGMARFALQCTEDDFLPATTNGGSWKNRIKSIRSIFGKG